MGYESAVVVRWGDPVLPDAPAFDFDNQTAEAQTKQFGYNCDFVTFFPMGRDRGLLWVNHEYTDENLMFRGYTNGDAATRSRSRSRWPRTAARWSRSSGSAAVGPVEAGHAGPPPLQPAHHRAHRR